ncbi:MAG: hypothetical protein MZV63_03070 [Marinilabiliales bacterium]|nr:hypothetical protein [Marinilabiliales bacterium]
MLIRTSDGKTEVLHYREKAFLMLPVTCSLIKREMLLMEKALIPHLASGVPGSVEGISNAHSKYGKPLFQ